MRKSAIERRRMDIMRIDMKKLSVLAMLGAVAFVVMVVGRIPMFTIPGVTLKYDPKDIIITIGGFLFGPLSAFVITIVVAFVEMVAVSLDGPWGLLMNIVASTSFACTASLIYKWKRSLKGAVIGLVASCLLTAPIMLLMNYLVVPLYTGAPRQYVVSIMLPTLLPFNLLKSGINAALTMLLYKPLKAALKAARLMPPEEVGKSGKINWGVIIISALLVASCVLLTLVLDGRL
ncbi:MAG: ECF transporter S component [Oscillospiraceae bacterium]|nr:ECF transporter S component [Oscillospiraceae bacterium]